MSPQLPIFLGVSEVPKPVYEYEYDGLLLVEYEEVSLRKPSFMILGLPDSGLVGLIAANHLVEALGLKEVGGIDFPKLLPPITVIYRGEPRTPIRFFASDNLLVVRAETPIPPAAIVSLGQLLVDYAMKRGVDYIVSIVGIAAPNRMEIEKPNVYWLASDEKAKQLAEKLEGTKLFESGYLVGPYALILKCAMRHRVSNIVVLADAYIEFPDPEAAAEVLKALSKAIGVEVNVKKLLDEAEIIRLRMRELMKQTRQALQEMRTPHPILYA